MDHLSRRALAKNSLINLAGFGIPLFAGLLAIPLIVRIFGVERFGVLTLGWALIGYFSLFDMGIGRAITQSLAARLNQAPTPELGRFVWTGLAMMLGFSVMGGFLVALLAPWFVSSVLNVPDSLRLEATHAFMWLAGAIPAVVLSAGLAGVLTALQRFGLINALRIPMGIMIFLIPLAISPFSHSVAVACAGLASIRVIFLLLHIVACLKVFPSLRRHVGFDRVEVGRLLSFGGWMTVSNIIGPFMTYMDRFVIGAALTLAAVAYYVTPYEIVIRFAAIPTAVAAVLFPAFAAGAEGKHLTRLYSSGGRAILAVLAPIVVVLVLYAEEGLRIWLGESFAEQSTKVLQWLALGVLINAYAQVPYALIQGRGRADWTAKLHLAELPLYLVLIFGLIGPYGIEGVALAWLLRAAVDAAMLTWLAHRLARGAVYASRRIAPLLLSALVLLAIGMIPDGAEAKLFLAAFSIVVLVAVSYGSASSKEKMLVKRALWSIFNGRRAGPPNL